MHKEIADAAEAITDAVHENADAVISDALDNAAEIKGDAAETVAEAAADVQTLTDQLTDHQRGLEWQSATQQHLTAIQTQIAETSATQKTILETLATLEAKIAGQMTPQNQPHHENVDAPPVLEAAEALSPEATAENQPPPKNPGKNWL